MLPLEAAAPKAALRASRRKASDLAQLHLLIMDGHLHTEGINCPPKREEPMKGVARNEDLRSLLSQKADASTAK